jgi:hypothetical protein
MQIRTAQSRAGTADAAMSEIARILDLDDMPPPDFVALHFAVGLSPDDLCATARSMLGGGALHGGSSCLGVMGSDGVSIGGAGLGVFAIWDADGSYGTAAAALGSDAAAAARATLLSALVRAGRPGELPDMVWLSASPGREEAVLAGLRSVLGPDTLIVGGSVADNDVTGQWALFGPDGLHRDGVVVSVLFPSRPMASVYKSGYAPIGTNGLVTRAQGRKLIEIDGRPAAEVLNEWSGGVVPMADDASPRSILEAATLWPLGRITRHVAGVPFHLLVHPATAHPDGSVDLFADVAEGDRLWQMRGTTDSVVERASNIAASARATAGGAVSGALVVYCGGCMLVVRDRLHEVTAGVSAALGDVPWLGVFTFGEQGVPLGDTARHGNLMFSCSVLAGPDA